MPGTRRGESRRFRRRGAGKLDAVEGFFEVASKHEVEQRLAGERYVEQREVSVG
jgi:hypothetical protein